MRLLLPALLALLLIQCGGTSATPEARSPGADASHEGSASDADDASDGSDASSEGSNADSEPQASTCDDGTCSKCGTGICPSGWYCDENANGGPACSWLKECADKPSCGCVTRVLGSSCKCREESGGLKVSCS
jgi:hypothetical protein